MINCCASNGTVLTWRGSFLLGASFRGRPCELLKLTLSYRAPCPMNERSGPISVEPPLPPGGSNGLDTGQVLPRVAHKEYIRKVHKSLA